MSTTYTSAQLRGLLSLVEKRDKLQITLADVESEIASAYNGRAPSPINTKESPRSVAKSTRGRKKRVKRGALRDSVLRELAAAGSKGLTVKALSDKLGIKNQNLHVWFSTTAKPIKGLKRIGVGLWSYSGG